MSDWAFNDLLVGVGFTIIFNSHVLSNAPMIDDNIGIKAQVKNITNPPITINRIKNVLQQSLQAQRIVKFQCFLNGQILFKRQHIKNLLKNNYSPGVGRC